MRSISRSLAVVILQCGLAGAQVPALLSYQGRLVVQGTNFTGTGQFRFALVNEDGSQSFWSNGVGTVTVPVTKGLYSVLLGGTGMDPVPWAVFTNSDVRLRVWFDGSQQPLSPDQRIAAVGYAMMAASVADGSITAEKLADGAVTESKIGTGAVTGRKIATGAVSDNHLAAGAAAANLAVDGQSSVGYGGIILSYDEASSPLLAAGYQELGTVQLGDAWQMRSLDNAPSARIFHTAVWTGSEMLIWGGGNGSEYAAAGGRFCVVSNTWSTMSTNGAPMPREGHTAVWASNLGRMIVWGGRSLNNYRADGGLYDPLTDAWTPVSTNGAPSARSDHAAVWTGAALIIWGGSDSTTNLNDGASYNPFTQSWTPMAASPLTRRHSVMSAWTGHEMVIFGGDSSSGKCSDGARYSPLSNTWTLFAGSGGFVGSPLGSAVWTGSRLFAFYGWDGGGGTFLGRFGAYRPTGDTWATPSSLGVTWRMEQSAVWSGSEMILWGGYGTGGYLPTGLRYDPGCDVWSPCTTTGAPKARIYHTAIWTAYGMIVFGGYSAGEYLNTTYSYQPPRTAYMYLRQ